MGACRLLEGPYGENGAREAHRVVLSSDRICASVARALPIDGFVRDCANEMICEYVVAVPVAD